ncbi:MFS transporter [Micromonospora carbonacea]|uniref:MFS transporter n=1 Tax=Micromonospora carbonacea TaxID=47853 RepID=A0A7H8XTR9_9ACTN|nr:MFS transporter [Micromonospora carbonacea]MBB5829930.1 MFS family permease [Micromonospora carbonacea]QLD28114.1 MFS transporter [Micromonospora carbonacea]
MTATARLRAVTAELVPPAGVVRVVSLSNLAKTAAHGIIMSVSVLYFTTSIGISATRVGLALTIGAAVGMLVAVPAGHAADIFGPRNATVLAMLALGLVTCGYAFATSFWWLTAVACLVLAGESATDASRGALVAGVVPPEERVRAWSYFRAVANLGVTLGAVIGGIGLYFDSQAGYRALLLLAGALFAVAGLAYLRVPVVPPTRNTEAQPSLVVLRDRPYAAFVVLNALLVMNGPLLTVALPIWIAQRTEAPTAIYPVILVINTICVVLLQVRVSRGAERLDGGAWAWQRAGLVLAACCVLFALAGGLPVWAAVAALLAGALVHVLGEMLHSSGAWSLAYGLAPEGSHGQYQGLFGMSTQLGSTITPFAATVLIIGFGWSGWLVFGAVMCAAGLLAPVVVRAARKDPTRSGFSAPDEPAKVPETRPATDEPTAGESATVAGDGAAGDPLSTDRS